METSKVIAFGEAAGKALEAISKVVATTAPDRRKDALQPILMQQIPGVLKALDELLLNPTQDDIAVMSMQVSVACKLFILATPGARREEDAGLVKELEIACFNYLIYKAEFLMNNEVLLNYLKANAPK